MTRPPRTARRAALLAIVMSLCLYAAATGMAAAAPLVSSNWSGYAARAASRTAPFESVSGGWRQPAASCRRGRESYVGVWVGLGGYSASSRALEQIGTDSDCTRGGQAVYATWFELVPAQPVQIPMSVHAGDVLAASVTVRRHDVTLRIRNLTTGARFRALRRTAQIDVSSAEWIVEAPSTCLGASSCATLPLTDFGTTTFTSATATQAGRTADPSDPRWSTAALELRQSGHPAGVPAGLGATGALVTAVPSPLAAGGSFSVAWSEEHPGTETANTSSGTVVSTVRYPARATLAPRAHPR